MDGKKIIEEDKEYIAGTYARFPVAFKSGKGCRLYDYDGKEYVDCGSGIAVNIFGVNHFTWVDAARYNNIDLMPMMKKYAEPLLRTITKESPYFGVAERLLRMLKFFLPFSDNWVPSNSLMREFIGGSCYADV